MNTQPGDLRLVALELPYFTDGNFEALVPETYGDEINVVAPSGRRDVAPAPTVEQHLAQHPEARVLHDRIASVLSDHYTTPKQISYRSQVGDRSISVIQLYLPERRIYFPGSPDLAITQAGGDLNALLNAAQQLGLRTTATSIEWPPEPGERMNALVSLLTDRFLTLFHLP